MDSMREIKQWILSKCRANSLPVAGTSKQTESSNLGGALTPKTIPDFIIPGSGESSRRASSEIGSVDDDFLSHANTPRSSIASCKTSPGDSPTESSICLSVPQNPFSSKSAPTSPRHEVKSLSLSNQDGFHSLGYLNEFKAYTNADPLSMAAISLPHIRSKTSFGFTTLSESPNTRRKESLFHTGSEGMLTTKDAKRLHNSLESLKLYCRPEILNDLKSLCDFDQGSLQDQEIKKGSMPSVIVTPTFNSPTSGSKHLTSSPEHKAVTRLLSPSRQYVRLENGTSPTSRYLKRKEKYYRRRSSLLGLEENNSSDSSSQGGSSNEPSPNIKRRSYSSLEPEKEMVTQKRHSSPILLQTPSTAEQKPRSSSCTILITPQPNSQPQFLTEHGELKFAFQYLASSKQLKVTLIKAENLGGHGKIDQNCNSYAKVCLIPGKLQKQTSEIVKHTRNPMYNQEFYFQGLTIDQLHSLTLRIKVFHKGHNLKLPEFIGEVNICFECYDLLTENRMWKDLDNKREKDDLGCLEVSLRFEPHEGQIHVGVTQAKGLPQHQITGQPDPYVRVEVSQPGRSVSRKQTKTRKNTSQPSFNETFAFSVSPKVDDMLHTSIMLKVFDHDRIRTDEVIGQIRLGNGGTQETEIDHWNETMHLIGDEVTKWHSLVDADDDFK